MPRRAPSRLPLGWRTGVSGRALGGPEVPYQLELALDGAVDAAEPGSDLLGRVAFHLPQRHVFELAVAQRGEQPAAFLRHLGRELGSRFPADHILEVGSAGDIAAAFLPAFMAALVEGLAGRDAHEE